MGTLDDAIREHLELKRRKGASEDEVKRQEAEALGGARRPAPPPAEEASPPAEAAPAPEGAPLAEDPWAAGTDEDLLEPDEVLPSESLEPNGSARPRTRERFFEDEEDSEDDEPTPRTPDSEPHEDPLDEWDEEVLQETPEFLEETPEHDRLWFEQRPPKDFDFD
jgi:hypothetical protein